MKHKDKFLSVFGEVTTELDTTDMSDKESLDIETIENGIMNKLETMISEKLKPIDTTPEPAPESTPESNPEPAPESTTESNKEEDSNNED